MTRPLPPSFRPRPEPTDRPTTQHRAEIEDAAAELADAAERMRSALYAATAEIGYRRTAEVSGLPLATVQRWRLEVPPSPTLRHAEARRG